MKKRRQERNGRGLAIMGAEPMFQAPLHVGRPNHGDRRRFLERVEGVLDRNWLTNAGPLVAELEQRIAGLSGTRYCVATCNGTIALEIAIRALGLHGEVIVPSFTFVATAHALQWQQIVPVFCDIDPETHCLDPAQVERLITPRTTAILGVHLWGRPAGSGPLAQIAQRHGLKLLFDAAPALGCTDRGLPIGRFGDAAVFSLHATKVVHALEGGAIVTDDEALAAKARLMRNFGIATYDCVEHIGTNGKMNEVSAAMGLTCLESLPAFVDHNRDNYFGYREELAGLPGLRLIEYDEANSPTFHYVVVEVDKSKTGLARDDLVAVLHAENVLARRYFYPGCHRMEPYRSLFPHAGSHLPQTEWVAERVLVLPTGMAIGRREVRLICRILRDAIADPSAVRAGVGARRAA